jgi:hypothetical protein
LTAGASERPEHDGASACEVSFAVARIGTTTR